MSCEHALVKNTLGITVWCRRGKGHTQRLTVTKSSDPSPTLILQELHVVQCSTTSCQATQDFFPPPLTFVAMCKPDIGAEKQARVFTA